MSNGPRPIQWRLWAIVFGIVAGVVVVAWLNWPSAPRAGTTDQAADHPLPPYSESAHLNTGPSAGYVGIETCKECHAANHRSFLHTAHSRALADLDPSAEPPDGTFEHKPSGRTYRVYRSGNQFRHEELLRSADGKEIARIDLPIRYLVGSGHFCRSYVVESDGFLHESPITWYTSRQRWDMSPGYDFPAHWSFERPVRVGCLVCHAGRVEEDPRGTDRVTLREQAIGCESCHGPGAQHVALHRAKQHKAGEDDLTIVHPGKLSRDRLEAVCAHCHLSGVATVLLRGRGTSDFRPGQPLTDYRIDYRFDAGSDQMTVVGHMEQLRRSACYQKSKDMTCLTCHDPHAAEKPKDLVEFHRQKCLDCHATKPCSVPREERLKKDARDNCATCHMPRGDTDIPHVAFTHHRISRPAAAKAHDTRRVPDLLPIDEPAGLLPLEKQRNLGLAYEQVASKPEYRNYADAYRERARGLLEPVHGARLPDAYTTAALARIYYRQRDYARSILLGQQAVAATQLSSDERSMTLLLLADCYTREHRIDLAIEALEKATQLRRFAEDWRLLGACYLELNDLPRAQMALEKAVSIRPFRADTHRALAEVYARRGDTTRAQEHREKAQWLTQHKQQ